MWAVNFKTSYHDVYIVEASDQIWQKKNSKHEQIVELEIICLTQLREPTLLTADVAIDSL